MIMQNEWNGIGVFVEHMFEKPHPGSLEILGKARELGDKYGINVIAFLLTHKEYEWIKDLINYGADHVIYSINPLFEHFNSDVYFQGMTKLIRSFKPRYMLIPATRNGVDIASRLAIEFDTNLTAHVIMLDIDQSTKELISGVPGFGGNIVAVVRGVKGLPYMATVSVGAFESKFIENREGKIEKVDLDIDESKIRIKVVEKELKEIVDISRAEKILIAGMGCQEAYDKVKKLAEKLGLAFGVTRPLADIGLAPRSLQIGSTGVNLKSKVAIILGVSGAPHFVSGIRDVEKVISVNIDDEAPILDHSDVFVLADLEEVVDKIYEKLGGE